MITIFNESGSVDVLADVVGYWRPGGGSSLTSSAPARVVDTRASSPLGAGESRSFPIAGLGGVPAGATAVVLNVTATNPTVGGYFTVYPSDAARPEASNLNFVAGQSIPNLVLSKLGADGTVSVFNAFGSTDVVVDVMGYFGPSGGTIVPLTPVRLLDTRTGQGVSVAGQVAPDGVVNLQVLGQGNVPLSGPQTVVLNVTVAAPESGGYLTVYPEGDAPYASNVNFVPGQTIPNLVIARIGSDGRVRILNASPGRSHVIADVVAWFD
jgi:hypothetical protein